MAKPDSIFRSAYEAVHELRKLLVVRTFEPLDRQPEAERMIKETWLKLLALAMDMHWRANHARERLSGLHRAWRMLRHELAFAGAIGCSIRDNVDAVFKLLGISVQPAAETP